MKPQSYQSGGNERTALMKRNIAGSFLVKGWAGVVQLLLVPVTLGCLNQTEYGIWIMLNSLLIWIDNFDIGLGNGLRNRLAEALAKGERKRARVLVSSTVVMLFFVALPVALVLIGVIYASDPYAWFNARVADAPDLPGILAVAVALVSCTFILKFIGNVYLALQLPAVNNLLIAGGQTVALLIIFVLSQLGDHSLLHVAMAYTAAPLLVYVLAYPVTFRRYPDLRPDLRLFDRQEMKGLLDLGVKFFFVQMAGLLIFQTSNFIISNLFTPADVTPYQIAYRYFNLPVIVFTLIAAPLWSASTDAYTRGDWTWIMQMMRRMQWVMLIFLLGLVVMWAVAKWVFLLWVGDKVEVGLWLAAAIAFYQLVLIFSTCYSNILFGIGKIRVITIMTVIEAVIYIPLAIWLGRALGVTGVVVALIAVNLLCAVTNCIQFNLFARGRARGIWDK